MRISTAKNPTKISTPRLLLKLWDHTHIRRKRQFVLITLLQFFASVTEVLSIGAVIPFLAVVTEPEKIMKSDVFRFISIKLSIETKDQLILVTTIAFIMLAVFASVVRILILRITTKVAYSAGSDFSINMYKNTLEAPYTLHLARNSSEVISGIMSKASKLVPMVIMPIITIIGGSLMIIAVLTLLLLTDPLVSLISIGIVGSFYLVVSLFFKKQIQAHGGVISAQYTTVHKSLQESLGGIRDVIIGNLQEFYTKLFCSADKKLRVAYAKTIFIGGIPRYAMEAVGMIMLASLAYYLISKEGGLMSSIPLLGSIALASQRLLPIVQQAYLSWINIKSSHVLLQDILLLLEQTIYDKVKSEQSGKIDFKKKIEFQSIEFKYDNAELAVLKKVNLTIRNGDRIGIIGKTGSGKSTLVDILLGLLSPSKGFFKVDNIKVSEFMTRPWQRNVAHVPQSIFLSDASISENIAFGLQVSEIDMSRVKEAAEKAKIADHINSLPDKYNTVIGERGVRLSGGQRQRIGIARALYRSANLIVFDEATSALDSETELAVMEAIKGLGKDLTLVIVAHRHSTLSLCNRIIELKNGELVWEGTYFQLKKRKNV